MDCAQFDSRFLSAVSSSSDLLAALPPDVRSIIAGGASVSNDSYLNTLSRLSLHPKYCSTVLACYEPLFPELVARWRTFASAEQMASGVARVLPVVPYLAEMAEEFLLPRSGEPKTFLSMFAHLSPKSSPADVAQLPGQTVLEVLLALHRLLCFRREPFIRLVSPTSTLPLLAHPHRAVRYLAVRILCIYLRSADAAQEEMFDKHGVGRRSEKVTGDWEGLEIDYGLLMVLEGKRLLQLEQRLVETRQQVMANGAIARRDILAEDLSEWVADICGVLIPRLRGLPSKRAEIVETPTTSSNIRTIAHSLRSSQPVLLTGPAGAGKTFLVHQIAQQLNAHDSLVSIHLGDQTDAKLLTGTYTTADTPGSFEWRSGVLTTAVREGRWVLVEDIDKAPTEVLSVLLPLVERGELNIPSRGEKIVAARGFRLIATIRTTQTSKPDHVTTGLLGARLWSRVNVQMPTHPELQTIVNAQFPLLHALSPSAIGVYDTVQQLYREPAFFALSKTSLGRQISPRDLFKWCTRMNTLLSSAGVRSGDRAIPDGLFDEIFREAVDCFASSLQTEEAHHLVVGKIAEQMHIPSQRVESFFAGHVPALDDSERMLQIGRARIKKRKDPTGLKRRKKAKGSSRRPFATTGHALRLLEQVGVAVHLAEPVLLVGETGTGKTTVVQQMADMLGYNLTAINLSQQTEGSDLLGGYKPVDVRTLAIPLKETFDELFNKTFSKKRNQKFTEVLTVCWNKQKWDRVIRLWKEGAQMAEKSLSEPPSAEPAEPTDPAKRKRKLEVADRPALHAKWTQFAHDVNNLERQSSQLSKSFAFSFVEGSLVKAARNGDWVLLDEINLAAPDTLESIADLLKDGGEGSILLSEKGDVERIKAHPDFRIFACMNPATDVGKRDLPAGLRNRFTELYVTSPDSDFTNLLAIVKEYIGHLAVRDDRVCSDVAHLYREAKKLAEDHRLVDGANQKPHFSIRTLTRTLSYVVEIASVYGLRRGLYEGFCMSFLTLLNRESERILLPAIDKYILGTHKNTRSLLSQIPNRPTDGEQYVQFRHYWMRQGPHEPQEQSHYIITPFVERNMLNLVRATATRRFPVLIQGPTSSGKTSMIEYLAKRTGHKFVRINNHEHTDLQEYLGSYVSDNDGQLSFQEGILVEALRKGHWIVLDELNLAPTDVLEALNRLLDDNRELLIPETQEVVRPHKDFMLFATQNPPGLYGGRKNLSRAFRNRFLELHFDDIPEEELETILRERCQIAPTYCKKIVLVYKELSLLRQSSRLFEQKNSFATLRDLFRWANREAVGYQQLAENGYMLLAERVRKDEEKLAVKKVIEKVMRVTIDEKALYTDTPEYKLYADRVSSKDVVWTKSMQRLFSLVAHAIRNNEPVLLVGETGCGKTTVCQMLADAFGKTLSIINAHQNTETGDIIGAQRPIRNRSAYGEQLINDLHMALQIPNEADRMDLTSLLKMYTDLSDKTSVPLEIQERIKLNQRREKALFEWVDGSLVTAMKEGQFFLLDEISLADDSVLERLNSVLESQRSMLLAEKGPSEAAVTAADGFQFLATMNPGGDYGKKELSPALRNRFTEIWVGAMSDIDDIQEIVRSKLAPNAQAYTETIVSFAKWFSETYNGSVTTTISIRDVLAWVRFINMSAEPMFGLVHGAAMVFIDALGANPSAVMVTAGDDLLQEKRKCIARLSELAGREFSSVYSQPVTVHAEQSMLKLGEFSLEMKGESSRISFNLAAPTTATNAMRVVRAMQLRKPVLLEGSPGVGKTSLISALAAASGNPLTRINLSEQTDLMDLFGSDVPVEGGQSGEFAWRDAPFLQAMQRGHWVLLDEMNLASQSILEGLNACLDHRGEAYVAELDRTFTCHPNFAVFAAQNPHHQGGGRKGLPASFVNRFTVVYVETLHMDDLQMIASQLYPNIPQDDTSKLIALVVNLDRELSTRRSFGSLGGPWEFNLRDTLRWLELLSSHDGLSARKPEDFVDIIIKQRFRSPEDRAYVDKLFAQTFGYAPKRRHLYYQLSDDWLQVGHALLPRRPDLQATLTGPVAILKGQLPLWETLITCVQQNMPCILVGSSGVGKSSIIKLLAGIAGAELYEMPLNSDVDTTDIVGGFEQIDLSRTSSRMFENLQRTVQELMLKAVRNGESLVPEIPRLAEYIEITHDEPIIERLYHVSMAMKSMASEIFTSYIERCETLIARAHEANIGRFEWVDGMLVRAIEEGQWLVLDNANLCSPSVLDRLNSLLEPNGFLAVNEHSQPNGEPTIVRPHPDFRLFVTMDPRHGELSRAMRNRGIEVFVEPVPMDEDEEMRTRLAKYTAATESTTTVYQGLERTLDSQADKDTYLRIVQGALQSVPRIQSELLQRWKSQLSTLPYEVSVDQTSEIVGGVTAYMPLVAHPRVNGIIEEFLAFLSQSFGLDRSFTDKQSLNPLRNTCLLSLHERTPFPIDPDTIAELLECARAIFDVRQTEEALLQDSATKKMGELTFLQRSANKRANSSGSAGSVGLQLFGFLSTIGALLNDWVNEDLGTRESTTRDVVSRLLEIAALWKDMVNLSSTVHLNEAVFHVYLALFQEWLNAAQGVLLPRFVDATRTALQVFGAPLKLTTGSSMEAMWNVLRPSVPGTRESWARYLELRGVMNRFDAVAGVGSLNTTSRMRLALVEAAKAVIDGEEIDELIKELKTSIGKLEASRSDGRHEDTSSIFAVLFDSLMKVQTVNEAATGNNVDVQALAHFAQRPTVNLLAHHGRIIGLHSSYEQVLEDLWSYPKSADAFRNPAGLFNGQLSLEMLRTSGTAKQSVIGKLERLDLELHELAKHVTSSTTGITTDKIKQLNVLLLSKLEQVVSMHEDLYAKSDFKILRENLGTLKQLLTEKSPLETTREYADISNMLTKTEDAALKAVAEDHLVPAIDALVQFFSEKDCSLAGAAWVHYALGCIKLYVPNVAFDPAMKPLLRRERYIQRKAQLSNRILAEKIIELKFTGNDDNFEISRLQRRYKSLGAEPPNSLIARPEVSQMAGLQGEFSNLLQVAVRSEPQNRLLPSVLKRAENFAAQEALFQQNLSMIVERLQNGYAVYKDIIDPVLGFVFSLKLGFSLAAMDSATMTTSSWVDGLLTPIPRVPKPIEASSQRNDDVQLLYLWQYAARSSIESYEKLDRPSKDIIQSIFQRFYQKWKMESKEAEQKAAADSSLYQYRGEDEDADDQEFRHMFPNYEEDTPDDEPAAEKSNRPHRELACQIAEAHSALYFGTDGNRTSLQSLIQRGTDILSKEEDIIAGAEKLQDVLPAVILSLKQTCEWVRGTPLTAKTYDFYTHENLEQAQRLVTIVEKTRRKLTPLHEQWPENVTLMDALDACQQVLDFPNVTPVAKFLTKVEKLHSILDEWQKIARASDNALEHYDALTQLLISWRRLELTTWPRLFDLEDEKCRANAESWWFFVYENVVALPMQLAEEEGQTLKQHIQQLVATLITFAETTTVGQFCHVLQLLRVFERQVSYLVAEAPAMEQVRSGIANFIAYYSQYEILAKEVISKERKRLEKEVADVVLLASWKDTNITALRESARRSHVKLYKVIKKYRRTLEGPIRPLLASGMPQAVNTIACSASLGSITPAETDIPIVKKIYETSVATWDQRPARLLDLPGAMRVMQRVAKQPTDAINATELFETFTSDIISTTKELQAETPSTLTEENKMTVKHLKSRKRKAFVDALRELRQMGLRSNVSSSMLQKQTTLEAVLASTASLDDELAGTDMAGSQSYFVRVLEVMANVRRSVPHHSEDLTGPEVARSVGYLEHLLSLNIDQRNAVVSASGSLRDLHATTEKYGILAKLEDSPKLFAEGADEGAISLDDAERVFQWLPQMLDLGIKLLDIHAGFSQTPFEVISKALVDFRTRAAAINDKFSAEARIHDGILNTSTKALLEDANAFLVSVKATLEDTFRQYPEIAYIVRQLLPWTTPSAAPTSNSQQATTLQQLDQCLQSLCDAIFVSLQKLHEAQIQYPVGETEDNAGWLLKHQAASLASLKALHIADVTQRANAIVPQIAGLQPYTSDGSRAIRALFAAHLPIVQQYASIAQGIVQQAHSNHRAACKTTYVLCNSAATLLSKGFCMPAEKSEESSGAGGLEEGTGLGEGEGAEDISKDVGADEDLSEMAQQKDQEQRKEEIEDEEDAVDMGQDDLEGEMGDKEEKGDDEEGEGDEEEEQEMDEETGDVDDLDPSAVDEKLWDEKGEDDAKEKEGEAQGKQQPGDEMEAKKENGKEGKREENQEGAEEGAEDDEEGEEEEGADQDDEVRQQDKEGMDEHVPEVDTLELPEDMNLDGDDKSDAEDEDGDKNMEDLSDVGEDDEAGKDDKNKKEEESFPELDAAQPEAAPEPDQAEGEESKEGEEEPDGEKADEGVEDELMDEDEGPDMPAEQPDDNMLQTQDKDESKEAEETAPSDAQAATAGGDDQQDSNEQASAQQESGEETKAGEQPTGKGTDEAQSEEQAVGQAAAEDADRPQDQQQERQEETSAESSFRKVGDVLEKWHQQRRQILDAKDEDKDRPQLENMELDDPEFEHLPDDETAADTQALGAATEEQAKTLDESMAIDSGTKENQDAFEDDAEAPEEKEDKLEPIQSEEQPENAADSSESGARAGAIIGESKDSSLRKEHKLAEDDAMDVDPLPHAIADELDLTASAELTTFPSLRPRAEARALWQQHEAATRSLSAGLCEQLRLILEPTQATRMRGDFRTGKRLNMKRIIPYIASSYKKDKIWMRRAKPSKRQYQVLLAVDDSRSMREGGSAELALETVALVARALGALEVGQIGVVSFGDATRVVHPFDRPFTADSGVDTFERFGFAQEQTDVRGLLEASLALFEGARAAGAGPADLWQLEIVVSDAICQDHEALRRLLRRAQEQRVMVVFVIVDSTRQASIVDLTTVKFVDGEVVSERYLDTFPFGYYLVVSDVRELPGVLAGALRQWFAESVERAG